MVVESQWSQVLERTVSDAIHHLNGRIMGLRGILYAAQRQPASDSELIAIIEEEIRRSEQFVAGLLSVPRGQQTAPVPMSVIDAVNQAVAAKRLNRTTEIALNVPRGIPLVIRASPNAVVKCLLLLLRAVAANRRNLTVAITVDVLPAPDSAAVVMSTEAGSSPRADTAIAEARELASDFGGAVRDSFEENVFTAVLVLPLVEAEPES